MNKPMNSNLLIIPFAFDEEHMASCSKSNERSRQMYQKCICVSCLSAKKFGGGADVALVTNADIELKYRHVLEDADIQIIHLEFSDFRFATDRLWYLAFYKLNAIYHIVRMLEYDNYCYLDTDVYVQNDLDSVWKECSENILLYDINHGLQVNDYRIIAEEFKGYFGEEKLITHYGGEFFAASRDNALLFSEVCLSVFNQMNEKRINTTKGDEYIVSIAGYQLRDKIKNAGAYIYRYWTGNFHLISTNYKYNPVCILHVPAEKTRGIEHVYKYVEKKGKLPKKETVWKYFHLQKSVIILFCDFFRKVIQKLSKV